MLLLVEQLKIISSVN